MPHISDRNLNIIMTLIVWVVIVVMGSVIIKLVMDQL